MSQDPPSPNRSSEEEKPPLGGENDKNQSQDQLSESEEESESQSDSSEDEAQSDSSDDKDDDELESDSSEDESQSQFLEDEGKSKNRPPEDQNQSQDRSSESMRSEEMTPPLSSGGQNTESQGDGENSPDPSPPESGDALQSPPVINSMENTEGRGGVEDFSNVASSGSGGIIQLPPLVTPPMMNSESGKTQKDAQSTPPQSKPFVESMGTGESRIPIQQKTPLSNTPPFKSMGMGVSRISSQQKTPQSNTPPVKGVGIGEFKTPIRQTPPLYNAPPVKNMGMGESRIPFRQTPLPQSGIRSTAEGKKGASSSSSSSSQELQPNDIQFMGRLLAYMEEVRREGSAVTRTSHALENGGIEYVNYGILTGLMVIHDELKKGHIESQRELQQLRTTVSDLSVSIRTELNDLKGHLAALRLPPPPSSSSSSSGPVRSLDTLSSAASSQSDSLTGIRTLGSTRRVLGNPPNGPATSSSPQPPPGTPNPFGVSPDKPPNSTDASYSKSIDPLLLDFGGNADADSSATSWSTDTRGDEDESKADETNFLLQINFAKENRFTDATVRNVFVGDLFNENARRLLRGSFKDVTFDFAPSRRVEGVSNMDLLGKWQYHGRLSVEDFHFSTPGHFWIAGEYLVDPKNQTPDSSQAMKSLYKFVEDTYREMEKASPTQRLDLELPSFDSLMWSLLGTPGKERQWNITDLEGSPKTASLMGPSLGSVFSMFQETGVSPWASSKSSPPASSVPRRQSQQSSSLRSSARTRGRPSSSSSSSSSSTSLSRTLTSGDVAQPFQSLFGATSLSRVPQTTLSPRDQRPPPSLKEPLQSRRPPTGKREVATYNQLTAMAGATAEFYGLKGNVYLLKLSAFSENPIVLGDQILDKYREFDPSIGMTLRIGLEEGIFTPYFARLIVPHISEEEKNKLNIPPLSSNEALKKYVKLDEPSTFPYIDEDSSAHVISGLRAVLANGFEGFKTVVELSDNAFSVLTFFLELELTSYLLAYASDASQRVAAKRLIYLWAQFLKLDPSEEVWGDEEVKWSVWMKTIYTQYFSDTKLDLIALTNEMYASVSRLNMLRTDQVSARSKLYNLFQDELISFALAKGLDLASSVPSDDLDIDEEDVTPTSFSSTPTSSAASSSGPPPSLSRFADQSRAGMDVARSLPKKSSSPQDNLALIFGSVESSRSALLPNSISRGFKEESTAKRPVKSLMERATLIAPFVLLEPSEVSRVLQPLTQKVSDFINFMENMGQKNWRKLITKFPYGSVPDDIPTMFRLIYENELLPKRLLHLILLKLGPTLGVQAANLLNPEASKKMLEDLRSMLNERLPIITDAFRGPEPAPDARKIVPFFKGILENGFGLCAILHDINNTPSLRNGLTVAIEPHLLAQGKQFYSENMRNDIPTYFVQLTTEYSRQIQARELDVTTLLGAVDQELRNFKPPEVRAPK